MTDRSVARNAVHRRYGLLYARPPLFRSSHAARHQAVGHSIPVQQLPV
jgi:hypothetical protein